MKAWRNTGNGCVEIDVDMDTAGRPILPPNTTVHSKPVPLDGHYVTVVGDKWVQIPIAVQEETLDVLKTKQLGLLSSYRKWYTEQPIEIEGVKFDADEQARNRLAQALIIYTNMGYLPPAWITFDNGTHVLASVEDLKSIVAAVQNAFTARFFECNTKRQAIMTADTKEAVNAVEIPNNWNMF